MELTNNDEYIDLLLLEVDKTIVSGNIMYIKNAIVSYSNYIDKSYIVWANSLILEIIQEKLEYIEIY
jgi:hypothetical protein